MTNDDEAERVRQAEEELLGVIDLDEVDRRTIDPTTDISITSLLRHKHNALADHVAKLEERSKEHHAEIELWREGLDKDWAQWSEGGSADIKGFIERQEKALAAFAQDHADRIEKLSGRIDDLVERHRLNMVAEDGRQAWAEKKITEIKKRLDHLERVRRELTPEFHRQMKATTSHHDIINDLDRRVRRLEDPA